MPATNYRIWGWGKSVEGSTAGAVHIAIAGIAKPQSERYPFEVINEIICGDLGRAIRLPIPPGIVVKKEDDNTLYHVSLNFSLSGEKLPPADPKLIVGNYPAMASGVILFDLWVSNHDRYEHNLSYDEDARALQVFDHGRALLCGKEWRKRLENPDDRDIIDSNCLSGEIREFSWFKHWADRIQALPATYIEDTVNEATRIGLPGEDAKFCIDHLLKRRAGLMEMVTKHKGIFHNLRDTLPGVGGIA